MTPPPDRPSHRTLRTLPPDNHVHSEWSWDTSAASMERTCARALRLGLPAVAFTEHVDFTVWSPQDVPPVAAQPDPETGGPWPIVGRDRVRAFDLDGYRECLERCRGRFPGLRIRSGIEAGEPHLFVGSVGAVLRAGRFDRVLGSLHAMPDRGEIVFVDEMFARYPAADVVRRYLAAVVEMVRASDVFEVLAHCDFIRRYWPQAAGPYPEAAFEEEYRAVFRELAGSGRALEINTRSPLWSVELVRWWHQEGGGAVSFGSDAHTPDRVGDRFALAVDVVEAAGFRPGRDPFDFWRR